MLIIRAGIVAWPGHLRKDVTVISPARWRKPPGVSIGYVLLMRCFTAPPARGLTACLPTYSPPLHRPHFIAG